jgi:hypothetical protein
MRTLLLITFLALTPVSLQAQFGGPRRGPGPSPSSETFTIVPRAGYDLKYQEGVVGLLLRIPTRVVPGLAVQAAGDFTFLSGATERQLSLDLVYDLGGIRLGGGPVFRNTYWGTLNQGRETRSGYSVVLGLGGAPGPRSPISVELELRFVWVDDFNPRPLTLGIGFAPGRLF